MSRLVLTMSLLWLCLVHCCVGLHANVRVAHDNPTTDSEGFHLFSADKDIHLDGESGVHHVHHTLDARLKLNHTVIQHEDSAILSCKLGKKKKNYFLEVRQTKVMTKRGDIVFTKGLCPFAVPCARLDEYVPKHNGYRALVHSVEPHECFDEQSRIRAKVTHVHKERIRRKVGAQAGPCTFPNQQRVSWDRTGNVVAFWNLNEDVDPNSSSEAYLHLNQAGPYQQTNHVKSWKLGAAGLNLLQFQVPLITLFGLSGGYQWEISGYNGDGWCASAVINFDNLPAPATKPMCYPYYETHVRMISPYFMQNVDVMPGEVLFFDTLMSINVLKESSAQSAKTVLSLSVVRLSQWPESVATMRRRSDLVAETLKYGKDTMLKCIQVAKWTSTNPAKCVIISQAVTEDKCYHRVKVRVTMPPGISRGGIYAIQWDPDSFEYGIFSLPFWISPRWGAVQFTSPSAGYVLKDAVPLRVKWNILDASAAGTVSSRYDLVLVSAQPYQEIELGSWGLTSQEFQAGQRELSANEVQSIALDAVAPVGQRKSVWPMFFKICLAGSSGTRACGQPQLTGPYQNYMGCADFPVCISGPKFYMEPVSVKKTMTYSNQVSATSCLACDALSARRADDPCSACKYYQNVICFDSQEGLCITEDECSKQQKTNIGATKCQGIEGAVCCIGATPPEELPEPYTFPADIACKDCTASMTISETAWDWDMSSKTYNFGVSVSGSLSIPATFKALGSHNRDQPITQLVAPSNVFQFESSVMNIPMKVAFNLGLEGAAEMLAQVHVDSSVTIASSFYMNFTLNNSAATPEYDAGWDSAPSVTSKQYKATGDFAAKLTLQPVLKADFGFAGVHIAAAAVVDVSAKSSVLAPYQCEGSQTKYATKATTAYHMDRVTLGVVAGTISKDWQPKSLGQTFEKNPGQSQQIDVACSFPVSGTFLDVDFGTLLDVTTQSGYSRFFIVGQHLVRNILIANFPNVEVKFLNFTSEEPKDGITNGTVTFFVNVKSDQLQPTLDANLPKPDPKYVTWLFPLTMAPPPPPPPPKCGDIRGCDRDPCDPDYVTPEPTDVTRYTSMDVPEATARLQLLEWSTVAEFTEKLGGGDSIDWLMAWNGPVRVVGVSTDLSDAACALKRVLPAPTPTCIIPEEMYGPLFLVCAGERPANDTEIFGSKVLRLASTLCTDFLYANVENMTNTKLVVSNDNVHFIRTSDRMKAPNAVSVDLFRSSCEKLQGTLTGSTQTKTLTCTFAAENPPEVWATSWAFNLAGSLRRFFAGDNTFQVISDTTVRYVLPETWLGNEPSILDLVGDRVTELEKFACADPTMVGRIQEIRHSNAKLQTQSNVRKWVKTKILTSVPATEIHIVVMPPEINATAVESELECNGHGKYFAQNDSCVCNWGWQGCMRGAQACIRASGSIDLVQAHLRTVGEIEGPIDRPSARDNLIWPMRRTKQEAQTIRFAFDELDDSDMWSMARMHRAIRCLAQAMFVDTLQVKELPGIMIKDSWIDEPDRTEETLECELQLEGRAVIVTTLESNVSLPYLLHYANACGDFATVESELDGTVRMSVLFWPILNDPVTYEVNTDIVPKNRDEIEVEQPACYVPDSLKEREIDSYSLWEAHIAKKLNSRFCSKSSNPECKSMDKYSNAKANVKKALEGEKLRTTRWAGGQGQEVCAHPQLLEFLAALPEGAEIVALAGGDHAKRLLGTQMEALSPAQHYEGRAIEVLINEEEDDLTRIALRQLCQDNEGSAMTLPKQPVGCEGYCKRLLLDPPKSPLDELKRFAGLGFSALQSDIVTDPQQEENNDLSEQLDEAKCVNTCLDEPSRILCVWGQSSGCDAIEGSCEGRELCQASAMSSYESLCPLEEGAEESDAPVCCVVNVTKCPRSLKKGACLAFKFCSEEHHNPDEADAVFQLCSRARELTEDAPEGEVQLLTKLTRLWLKDIFPCLGPRVAQGCKTKEECDVHFARCALWNFPEDTPATVEAAYNVSNAFPLIHICELDPGELISLITEWRAVFEDQGIVNELIKAWFTDIVAECKEWPLNVPSNWEGLEAAVNSGA